MVGKPHRHKLEEETKEIRSNPSRQKARFALIESFSLFGPMVWVPRIARRIPRNFPGFAEDVATFRPVVDDLEPSKSRKGKRSPTVGDGGTLWSTRNVGLLLN